MPATVPLGRVAGIGVTARWSALAGTALIGVLLSVSVLPTLVPGHGSAAYALAGGLTAVGFGASLLAHELAHSVVARHAGVEVRGITLWLLGGVSELATPPRDPAAEVRIALAGPATSVALGILTGAVAAAAAGLGASALPLAALSWLAMMNVVLGVFNLLPGTPLDGGRVLHGVLWRHSGDRARATRIASTAGRVLGAVLAGLGALLAVRGRLDGLWLVLVGWFIAGSAAAESDASEVSARLAGLRVADVMSAPACTAPGWQTVSAFAESLTAGGPESRHRSFPVVDFDGRVTGTVELADLVRCPAAERPRTRVGELARPLPPSLVLAPGAPLEEVLRGPLARGSGLGVVVDGGVVGVLTGADLVRAAQLGALAAR
ncbi:MAG: site-2 protease family protein [Pseudonocardia sp.]